jgi:L-fuconate dehydratase
MLLAAKFGVPVCPHAGGVGLCELVQHLAMFDYVRISRKLQMIEYADHLHEHFVSPARIVSGRYQAPEDPGFSAELTGRTLADYRYPDGRVWAAGGTGGSSNGRGS